MGPVLILFVLVARFCHGDQKLTESTNNNWLAKAVVNIYDGNRSFSENFNSIAATLCPSSRHCANNENHFFNAENDPSNDLSAISEDLAIVNNGAERLRSCCLSCSCDKQCTESDNCCPGAAQNVPPQDGTRPVKQECVFAGISSYIQKAIITKEESTGMTYFMVTECFSANVNENIAARCRHPELENIGPVYSPSTQRIYKNRICAECNGDDHVISWLPVINFNQDFSLTGHRQIPSTLKDLYTSLIRSRKFLNLFYMPPYDINIDKYTCVVSAEMKQWTNPCKGMFDFDRSRFLERACGMGGIPFQTQRGDSANVFCYLCNNPTLPDTSVCDIATRSFKYSFTAVIGFNNNVSPEAPTVVKNTPCDCREYYDHSKNLCRRIMCPPGEYFASCTCVKFLQSMHGMSVKMYLELDAEVRNPVQLETFTTKLNSKAIKSFKASVEDIINTRWGPLGTTYSTLFRETSVSDKDHLKFHIAVTTQMYGKNDNRNLAKNIMKTLKSGISIRILDSPMTIHLGPIFNVFKSSSENALSLANTINSSDIEIEPVEANDVDIGFVKGKTFRDAQTISKLVYCMRVVLEEAEAAVLRTRPRTLGLSLGYIPYVFLEEDGSMCLEDFKITFLASPGTNTWVQSYVTIVVALIIKWIV